MSLIISYDAGNNGAVCSGGGGDVGFPAQVGDPGGRGEVPGERHPLAQVERGTRDNPRQNVYLMMKNKKVADGKKNQRGGGQLYVHSGERGWLWRFTVLKICIKNTYDGNYHK